MQLLMGTKREEESRSENHASMDKNLMESIAKLGQANIHLQSDCDQDGVA